MANKTEEIKKAKDGLDVWPDLLKYSKTGYASIPPDDMARLRWYGIYEQQPRAGHFMMRVKIPGGDATSAQFRVLARISREFGRGIADLTTRQNIQFHWLTIENIPEAIRMLHEVGLTTTGACGDIARNVAGCPVAGLDPDEIYDCRGIIHEVTRFFLGNRDFSDLPRKYKITIGGCRYQCYQPEINDLAITAVRVPASSDASGRGFEEGVGFHVRVGGGLSTQPKFSQRLDMLIRPDQVLDVARAVTEIFRDYGYRERRNHARLKFLVADWGAEKFRQVLVGKLGWDPLPAVPGADLVSRRADHLGIHAQKQPGLYWIGVPVLCGRLSADQMDKAANIAEEFCHGAIRTTNQQNLIFPNISELRLDAAMAALRSAGFEWNVSRFRREGIACTGTEFCNLAITETKQRLREIIEHLEDRLEWDEPIRINLNGCPNSCGQHHIGDIGLQGCLARMDGVQVEAYDISLGGRLGADARFTRPIRRKVPADKVKYALENLLRSYLNLRDDDETFSLFVDRHTDDELAAMLGLDLMAEDDPSFVPPPRPHASVAD